MVIYIQREDMPKNELGFSYFAAELRDHISDYLLSTTFWQLFTDPYNFTFVVVSRQFARKYEAGCHEVPKRTTYVVHYENIFQVPTSTCTKGARGLDSSLSMLSDQELNPRW